MPYTPTTTFNDGDSLAGGLVRDEVDAIFDWFNAVPLSDLLAGAMLRRHVQHPEAYGWPMQGHYGASGAGLSPRTPTENHVSPFLKRYGVTVWPMELDPDDRTRIAGLCLRTYLRASQIVTVTAQVTALEIHDPFDGSTIPSQAGTLRLAYERVPEDGTAPTFTDLTATDRMIWTASSGRYVGDPNYARDVTLQGAFTPGSAGVYDVFVYLDASTAHADVRQWLFFDPSIEIDQFTG